MSGLQYELDTSPAVSVKRRGEFVPRLISGEINAASVTVNVIAVWKTLELENHFLGTDPKVNAAQ